MFHLEPPPFLPVISAFGYPRRIGSFLTVTRMGIVCVKEMRNSEWGLLRASIIKKACECGLVQTGSAGRTQ